MREAFFIKKNKDRWASIASQTDADPDETATQFAELVEDLSFAKTFYPHSSVTHYLNGQAARIYLNIYQNRKEERNRFWEALKYDIPIAIKRNHAMIFISFILFFLLFAAGIFSSWKDPDFVNEMFGEEYVNETISNIESGKPFKIYDQGNEFLMWIYIMVNNIKVAVVMYAGGLLLGLYPLRQLIIEGLRLGSFFWMFHQHALGREFYLTVFIHGTLEIFSLIVAGAAGLILGKSLILPGKHSRKETIKRGAKDSLKIFLIIFPMLIAAAFLEGFVTRHYHMPLALNLFILVASTGFIVFYFFVYPIVLHRKLKKAISFVHED